MSNASILLRLASRREEVQRELAAVFSQLQPLQQRHSSLLEQQEQIEADVFIFTHDVKEDEVERDPTWHGTVWSFVEWIKANRKPPKRFTLWNSHIFWTNDLVSGRLVPTPARTYDLARVGRWKGRV